MTLANRTVLITGGSRGIGAAAVRQLAAKGAFAIIHYGRNRQAAEAVLNDIGGHGALVEGDLGAPGAGRAVWEQALALAPNGKIDVLVNNAATFAESGVNADWDRWTHDWANTIQVNVIASADLCKCAIPHFEANGGGRVVTLISRAAHRGDTPDYMHYAASKAAQAALTKSIARGFAAKNILAYNIAPGFTRTEMAEDWVRVYGEAAASADIPLGRMATPDEVANVIVYCAGEAPAAMTGTTIDVNGGSYIRA
ncbi:SDR family NAD(P)-dependent oxidoreductase [Pedomonas mirosovicensis]|uniref:SDR family NAD(P)-dependent oxidoreductase n=1 Tax=Pedomonas mirosovicensis TaxID=2908641 RepID=UPI00216A06DC|nr:SDR family oxidoreductase [Pedomonas mirosovicensis]MCH8685081.1 SDR family oxidoreductase [Pedomonas mirosovicensis]